MPDLLAGFRRMKHTDHSGGEPAAQAPSRRDAWQDDGDGGEGSWQDDSAEAGAYHRDSRGGAAAAALTLTATRSPAPPPERPAERSGRHVGANSDQYGAAGGGYDDGSQFDDDEADSVSDAEEPPKELYWSELSGKFQDDARQLGWTSESWDGGDVGPFATPWDELTVRQKRAAGHLGFTADDWDDGNESVMDRSNVSETWLQQAASAVDPVATRRAATSSPVMPLRPEPARRAASPPEFGAQIPTARRDERHPLVAVFEELDREDTGLVGRAGMLERLRADGDLRMRLRLQVNHLDDEAAAFERVFHAMDTDPHYEVENLTLDEFLAYVRAHRHRAEDFSIALRPTPSAAGSSTQYAESELEAVQQKSVNVNSGFDQVQREQRLAHAAAQAQTKVVIFVRLPATSHVDNLIGGVRRQQRRGFVMVDAAAGTLADVREEMERQKMPVPRPFAFVMSVHMWLTAVIPGMFLRDCLCLQGPGARAGAGDRYGG